MVLGVLFCFVFPPAGLLGIEALSKPDYGSYVECRPEDVPVFWPSPLTSLEAVISCSMLVTRAELPQLQPNGSGVLESTGLQIKQGLKNKPIKPRPRVGAIAQ